MAVDQEAPPLVVHLARVTSWFSLHPPSCGPVSLSSRWSSRWLLPSQWKEALHRQALDSPPTDGEVGLEGKAGCCGLFEASPTPPVPFMGIISPGACSCGIIGLVESSRRKWQSSEHSSPPGLGHCKATLWAQPHPRGPLPVTPPSLWGDAVPWVSPLLHLGVTVSC